MNRNFFVRLAFATHRVADALRSNEEIAEEIREAANAVLADLLLLCEKEVVSGAGKQSVVPRLERQLDILIVYFQRAKKEEGLKQENFAVLETEYEKIREMLEMFEGVHSLERPLVKQDSPVSQRAQEEPSSSEAVSERQQKIIEFLKTKENAQVWELQKILPQVTKRTLRRDLDELLQKNLVERKGEWNAVSYELKERDLAVEKM